MQAKNHRRDMWAKRLLAGVVLAGLAAVPTLAQSTGNFNLFGTIEKADATAIALKNDTDGAVETFKRSPTLLTLRNKPATLADIAPGDFVASAARRGTDGKLHSTELRIFPPAMRGVGEGQRPMNDPGNQTMTNATVTGAVVVDGSNNLKVRFEGGESELILDPGVPVTRIDTADASLVTAGAKVRMQGVRNADGATVTRITVQ